MNREKRICKNPECQKAYEPKYLGIINAKLLLGDGWCPACSRQELNRMEAAEKAQKLANISRTRSEARKRTGIPPRFMSQDFSTFEKSYQEKALENLSSYAESFPVRQRAIGYPSLIVYSKQSWGVGKTHLSCAIIHRILDRWDGEGRSCPNIVFISEYDLFRSIQATYNFSTAEKRIRESEEDIIKRLTFCDLLVIDDVGKESRQDPRFVQRILFSVIDGRYKRDIPIILTANKTPEQLKSHLGHTGSDEASFDRIWEMTQGKALAIDGSSYRRR